MAAGEPPCKPPDRKHVDALLDISEEAFLGDLEPYCYSGCEETVKGWARAAPLSCILLAYKGDKKPKHKEADRPAPLHVDRAFPIADSSTSMAESHMGPQNSFEETFSLDRQMGSWCNPAVAALQKEASDNVLNAAQTTKGAKMEEDRMHRETTLQNRSTKFQKPYHMVPITNLTFVPPVDPPHLGVRSQLCSGRKGLKEETTEENCVMCGKKRGTSVDPGLPTSSTDLAPKYQTCQEKPHLSTVS